MARVLVIGVGGIGGTIAGRVAERGGHTMVCCSRNAAVRSSLLDHGYRLAGVGGEARVPAEVVEGVPEQGPFDFVFLATQPPQMIEAARSASHLLEAGAQLVCFQNGLPERHLEEALGRSVVGCIVGWGASMTQPGVFERTSAGRFTLQSSAPEALVDLLETVAPVKRTDDLQGARWSKLAVNAVISTLGTIGGDTLGSLIRHTFVRRLALEIFTETLTVTRAAGIRVHPLAGVLDLERIALDPGLVESSGSPRLFLRHTALLVVGAKYRRLRSSMLAAIERGRAPAVDWLNGEIVALGERHGVPTPVNRAATATVHRIAAGEASSSVTTLRTLYEQTRSSS